MNTVAAPVANMSIAKHFPALPHAFFCRPAEVVGPELIGCRLVKRQGDGSLLWGVIRDFPDLPQSFFCRPAGRVAPNLFGCLWVEFCDLLLGIRILKLFGHGFDYLICIDSAT